MIVFIDDILIYSKNNQDHSKNLQEVLEVLKKEKQYSKFYKCDIWIREIHFLGQVVRQKGIMVDPKKIKAVMNGRCQRVPLKYIVFLDWQVTIRDSSKIYHLLRLH